MRRDLGCRKSVTAATSDDRPGLAVGLICTATLCFAIMAGCIKLLATDLPHAQTVWGRCFFHALLFAILFPRNLPHLLKSQRIDLQIVRSTLVFGATVTAFLAIRYLPLADIAAISFVGPLIVVGLARVFLDEQVSARCWVAVCIGFGGVLIILRPGFGTLHWAVFLPLVMATCYAAYQIITRRVRGLASPLTTLFYTSLVGTVASSMWVPFVWQTPSATQWLLMIASGLFGGAGHLAIIKAYESAPVSVAGPFVYSELLWAIGIGYWLFGDLPDLMTLVGAAVLIATGIYLLRSR